MSSPDQPAEKKDAAATATPPPDAPEAPPAPAEKADAKEAQPGDANEDTTKGNTYYGGTDLSPAPCLPDLLLVASSSTPS